jgi:hypothetical protein
VLRPEFPGASGRRRSDGRDCLPRGARGSRLETAAPGAAPAHRAALGDQAARGGGVDLDRTAEELFAAMMLHHSAKVFGPWLRR